MSALARYKRDYLIYEWWLQDAAGQRGTSVITLLMASTSGKGGGNVQRIFSANIACAYAL